MFDKYWIYIIHLNFKKIFIGKICEYDFRNNNNYIYNIQNDFIKNNLPIIYVEYIPIEYFKINRYNRKYGKYNMFICI